MSLPCTPARRRANTRTTESFLIITVISSTDHLTQSASASANVPANRRANDADKDARIALLEARLEQVQASLPSPSISRTTQQQPILTRLAGDGSNAVANENGRRGSIGNRSVPAITSPTREVVCHPISNVHQQPTEAIAAGEAMAGISASSSLSRRSDSTSTVFRAEAPLTVESPSMAFNTDSDSFRRKYLGPSSLQVYSQWLELSFQSLGASISRRFKFGMRICEEMDLPLSATLPILPTEWRRYVNVFFDNMHPLFPLLDREAFTSRAEHISESGSMQATPAASRPYLACLYAVVSIGMDEASQSDSQPDYQYLQAAYSLYAHLVALPYFESAQALLLLTIALRGRNKDGAAWQTLGQAIRILQSLGLHRRRPPGQNGHDLAAELDKRVWWSAYCLEKLLVFEAGRPSMIHDGDVDQELPTPTMHPDVLSAMIGLCRIQESIISRLYNKRMWTTVQKPRNVLLATGELDALLIQWAESLPRTLRPDYDMGSCPPELHTFRSFLTMQFQQTMVTLHRSALLMDSSIHRANIDSFCSHTPFAHRLRSSETVCVRAARSIISVFLDSTHGSCTTRLNTLTQPLLAIYVLGIFIMKHPTAWTARSDLTLLQAGAEVVEQCYRDYGFDPEFCAMMSNLVRIAARYVDHSPSGAGGRVRKATTGTPPVTGTFPAIDTIPGRSLGSNQDIPIARDANNSRTLVAEAASTTRASSPGLCLPLPKSSADVSDTLAHGDNVALHLDSDTLLEEWSSLWPRIYLGDLSLEPDLGAFQSHDDTFAISGTQAFANVGEGEVAARDSHRHEDVFALMGLPRLGLGSETGHDFYTT